MVSDPFSFAANAIPNRPSGNTGRVYRGYPMNAASAMSAVTTTGANLMIIGDPRAFVIVDRIGMNVELMDAEHHDIVLALTSHLPHLIAYCIVHTMRPGINPYRHARMQLSNNALNVTVVVSRGSY